MSVAIGVAFAWLLIAGGLPIVPERSAFAELRPWAVPVYAATLGGVHLFRAVRWRHLLRPIGQVSLRSVLATAWIGFAAVLFLPLRTGEVVRPYLVSRRGTVRGWEAAGTVAAERLIDGLVLSAILLGALQLSSHGLGGGAAVLDPLPDRVGELDIPVATVPGAAYSALLLFAACVATMAIFYWQRAWALRALRATVGLVSAGLAERLAAIVDRIAGGLRFLPSPRRLGPFLLETIAYWAVNAVGLWLLAQGCGLSGISLVQACTVMGCLGIGILVPSGPGFFGTFQLSVYLALAMFVPPEQIAGPGSAFVFLAYSCQLGQHLLGALVGAVLDRLRGAAAAAPSSE